MQLTPAADRAINERYSEEDVERLFGISEHGSPVKEGGRGSSKLKEVGRGSALVACANENDLRVEWGGK